MSITPEYLRQLSRRGVQLNDWQDYIVPANDIVEYNHALRAAADQLEAVREWAELELEGEQPNEYQRGYQMAAAHARRFVVTADTAPQEDRDQCGVVTESSAGPLVCTAPRSHDGAHNTEGAL